MTRGQGVDVRAGYVGRPGDRHLLAWGVIGVIAQVAFMAGWLISDTWQGPRYSPVRYTISDLQAATAPHAWFPIACFAVGGRGTFGFAAFGLRSALAAVLWIGVLSMTLICVSRRPLALPVGGAG